jgi:peptidoglycan/LPS O-acetylase OafA/YrhL
MKENNFNAIRLLLAALVIVSHGPEMLDGDRSREVLTRLFHTMSFGEVAVAGFFMLSGYLIVQSWLRRPEAGLFLRKRLLRIVPAYLVAAVLCTFVVGPLGADKAAYFSQFWWGGLVKSIVLLDTPLTPATFAGTPYPSVNGAMWTIHYEFLCYLTVLALGLAGVLRWRAAPVLLVAAAIAVWFATRAGLLPLGRHGQEEALIIARFTSFFFAGGLFYRYRQRIVFRAGAAWLALAGLLICLCDRDLAEPGLLVFGSYLLFFCAFAVPARSGRWLARLRSMPDASYGLYLYGWPLSKLLAWYLPGISPALLVALTLPLAYGVGRLSWAAIESPALAWKNGKKSVGIALVPGEEPCP